jgi:methylated-DNA-[protein]-cysteine S-methyltransferase
MYYSTLYHSPVGDYTMGSDGEHLIGLWKIDQKYYHEEVPENIVERNDLPLFAQARKWLDSYFSGERPNQTDLPLAPIGGAFRQIVWEILLKIPYGELVTYGDVARRAAAKMGRQTMSSQAVGGAVGHNPISIIIPCHRVVGAKGNLTGYAGGISTKIKLLELEGHNVSELLVPKKGSAL